MATKHITVHSAEEAWQKANEIFPTDYEQDGAASARAGYPIYCTTRQGFTAWISDLGTRLELNLPELETVNIWIEEEEEEETEETEETEEVKIWREAREALKSLNTYALTEEPVIRVSVVIGNYDHCPEEERIIYKALKTGSDILFDIIERWAEENGIEWGGISSPKVDFIENRNGGHAIVRGLVSARIGKEMSFTAKCADRLAKIHEEHTA